MEFVTYAQNFEDVMLWRALKGIEKGFYIDIGAQDPVSDSVSKAFYDHGWRGIHVEPQANYAEKLRLARPDETVIQAAVSDAPGLVTFYSTPDTGLSTVSGEIAEQTREAGWPVFEHIVPAITLDTLLEECGSEEIHWLKIDVEGFELAALEGWKNSNKRPWILVIEAIYPMSRTNNSSAWEKLVLIKGYEPVYFDGINQFYVSDVHPELALFFAHGPSLWDEFQIPSVARPARELMQQASEQIAASDRRAELLSDELVATRETLERRYQEALELSSRLQDGARHEIAALREDLRRVHAESERSAREAQANAAVSARKIVLLGTELAQVTGSFWWRLGGAFHKRSRVLSVLAREADTSAEAGTRSAPPPAKTLAELLDHSGEAFVRAAYVTLLGREPDPDGLDLYLDRLARNPHRELVIAALAASDESRRFAPGLPGLQRLVRTARRFRTPVVRPLARLCGLDALVYRRVIASAARSAQAPNDVDQSMAHSVRTPTAAESPALLEMVREPNRSIDSAPGLNPGETHRVVAPAPLYARWRKQPTGSVAPLEWKLRAAEDGCERDGGEVAIMTDALAEAGQRVTTPGSMPAGSHDATSVIVGHHRILGTEYADSPVLFGLDWDETGYPANWARTINSQVGAVATASSFASKVLVDHGVLRPVATVGVGLDDWDSVAANGFPVPSGKSFRFLHVSDGGAEAGADLVVRAFARAFNHHDDAVLVLVVPEADQGRLRALVASECDDTASAPEIIILAAIAAPALLKGLYGSCQVFVSPRRGGGFSWEVARALLCGLPVIATGFGGSADYLASDCAWLLDYSFVHAASGRKLPASAWAQPNIVHLEDILLRAYRSPPELRNAMARIGADRLRAVATWSAVAKRLAQIALEAVANPPGHPVTRRFGFLTTWHVKCGIATISEELVAALGSERCTIFAGRERVVGENRELILRPDDDNCFRCWLPDKSRNSLDDVLTVMETHPVDTLLIHFNYGFFNFEELNRFVARLKESGVQVFIEMHSTVDPQGAVPNWQLAELLPGLEKCDRILAHSVADMNRLKTLGLVDNVMLFPHGVTPTSIKPVARAPGTVPLLATFGFCFPNKGLLEMIQALAILRDRGIALRLRMLNAVHVDPASEGVAEEIRAAILALGFEDRIEFVPEFLSIDECLVRLNEADLIVNPYQVTGESASGAARVCLRALRPVLVTPLPIFDDLGDVVFRTAGVSPADLADGVERTLAELAADTHKRGNVLETIKDWLNVHDFSRQGERLLNVSQALYQQSLRLPNS